MRLSRVCFAVLGVCASHAWAKSDEAVDWQGVAETFNQEHFGSGKPLAPDEVANATQRVRLSVRNVQETRPNILAFIDMGRLMDCLMRSTQQEADNRAANDPNLAGKPMTAQYTDPARLAEVGWVDQRHSDADFRVAMAATLDARTFLRIGGDVVLEQRYAGDKVLWRDSVDVQNRQGVPYVSPTDSGFPW
jgi:hypothetical protein